MERIQKMQNSSFLLDIERAPEINVMDNEEAMFMKKYTDKTKQKDDKYRHYVEAFKNAWSFSDYAVCFKDGKQLF
ncbi:MAG: hypothetical protein QME45_01150 [Clostridiales bacterium]|nr:hypothetical protein [Clostridiales bacterium]